MKLPRALFFLLISLILSGFFASSARADITTGLLGHWAFDEGSGTTAADTSGNSFTGTLGNGATWVAGKIGQAVSLDGTNDLVSVSSNPAFAFSSGVTISEWIYPTKSLAFTRQGVFENSDAAVLLDVRYNDSSAGTLDWGALAGSLGAQGTWYHVVGTADASGYKLYVNGALVDSNATAFTGVSAAGLNFGLWDFGANYGGYIDDARVYSRAITSGDVTELYALGNAAPTLTTQSASSLTTTGATLNGTITDTGGASATVRGFVYGTNTTYGATTTENGTFSTGSYTASISSLTQSTLYHVRAYATNPSGTGYGSDITFTTSSPDATPPVISSIASSTNATTAAVSWTTDESASSTVVYGLTTGYGSSLTSDSFVTSHTMNITGLAADTVYHFKVSSSDSSGNVAASGDKTFRTAVASGSSLIPSDAQIDWAGNIAFNRTIPTYAEVACNPTDNTGATDMAAQIQACLDGAASNRAVKLPTGIYRINSTVSIPSYKVLKGNGASNTKIMLHNAGTVVSISAPPNDGSQGIGTVGTMKTGATNWVKDSQTISVTQSAAFSVGDYVMVKERNLAYCSDSNCSFSGTHTGGSGASTLTDSIASWTTNQWVGYKIEDYTGKSAGTITANTSNTITATLTSYVSPAGATTWSNGDAYRIYPANNTYSIPTLIRYNYADYTTSQIVQVTSKSSDLGGYYDVGLSRPLYATYDASQSPQIYKLGKNESAGLENIYVEKADNTAGSNISASGAMNCWVRNVESNKTYNYHVFLGGSYGCVIRDSYFHESWLYGGNAGYGIAIFNNSTDNLVENNAFYHDRHSLELEIGPSGNIFGYNYSKDPLEGLPLDWLTFDAAVHGGNVNMNLFEGNVIASIGSDYATGGNKYNTFFRNWATRNHSAISLAFFGNAANIQMENLYTNLIGNIFNTPGVTSPYAATITWGNDQSSGNASDTRPLSTANMCGNYDYYAGAYQSDNSACGSTIPSSLYYSAKPSWFGSVAWPPIGPDVSPKVNSIPAQLAYETAFGNITPTISSINTDTTDTGATITWTTDELATTTLRYGLTPLYTLTGGSSTYTSSHSVSLSGLVTGLTYHYQVASGDASHKVSLSSDRTFTPGGVVVDTGGGGGGGGGGGSSSSGTTHTAATTSVALAPVGTILSASQTSELGKFVELLIALGVISPDKVDKARAFVASQTTSVAAASPSQSGISSPCTYLCGVYSGSTADIKTLQTILASDPTIYPGGFITGALGPLTISALQKFQIKYGIANQGDAGYGFVGPKTKAKLLEISKSLPVTQTPEPVSVPKPTNPLPQTPAPAPTPVSTSVPVTTFTRSLSLGSEGEDVRFLQKILNKAGFAVADTGPGSRGKETTTFDQSTKLALEKFQTDRGIFPVSGAMGEITKSKLLEAWALK